MFEFTLRLACGEYEKMEHCVKCKNAWYFMFALPPSCVSSESSETITTHNIIIAITVPPRTRTHTCAESQRRFYHINPTCDYIVN